MTTENLLYEGKAKKVFSTTNPDEVIVEYKNSLTAFNAQKKGEFAGKGALNRDITSFLFQALAKKGIPTHWIEDMQEHRMRVQKLKIIPLEVVVRNILAGSLAKKLGRDEGEVLSRPLVEFYFKDDALGDPFLSEDQAMVLKIADEKTLQELKKKALEINQALTPIFAKAGLKLVDFKLEFGTNPQGKIMLGDEISPDTCRLWDEKSLEKFDKDRFRRDLGGVEQAYKDVLKRLKG